MLGCPAGPYRWELGPTLLLPKHHLTCRRTQAIRKHRLGRSEQELEAVHLGGKQSVESPAEPHLEVLRSRISAQLFANGPFLLHAPLDSGA